MDNFFSCVAMAVTQKDMRFSMASVRHDSHWRAWRAGIEYAYYFLPGANHTVYY